MNNEVVLEKNLKILRTLYDKTEDEVDKARIKQYYNIELSKLIAIRNRTKEVSNNFEDKTLNYKINRVKRLHNKKLASMISNKCCSNFLKEKGIKLDKDTLEHYYFMIKRDLMNNSDGKEFKGEYKKNRLLSILLDTKVVKQFDRKFSTIDYSVDEKDDLFKKGLGKC